MNIKKNMKKWLFLALILSAVCVETISAARLHSDQSLTSTNSTPIRVNAVTADETGSTLANAGDDEESNRDIVFADSALGVMIEGEPNGQGMYDHLTIRTPVFQGNLPGQQVQNPTYAPWVAEADLDGDGQPELIVNLTSGYGTGMELNTIQVFSQNGENIPVEALQTGMARQFSASINGDQLALKLNGVVHSLPLKNLPEQTVSSKPPVFGGAVQQFKVDHHQITAIYSLQVGVNGFIGELDATYRYENGMLRLAPAKLNLQ
ncbi:hypothetical protein [Paenibacillus campi]|uniref:hypothetical protein n=1 Tax=Paenibacillus campi TaxID=3106031 RepID=UPI002B0023CD|nr:hypothetical protein [Paenibacillus sp. SGZ-1014]